MKYKAGKPNVVNNPIISRDKTVFPPLHIKLGLMKQFVKAVSLDSECFSTLSLLSPVCHMKRSKRRVFDGPQIRTLMRDQEFVQKMNAKEKAACLTYELPWKQKRHKNL